MNEHLTDLLVENVTGAFSFKGTLLVWNSYKCHIEDTVKKSLIAKKIFTSIVPDGSSNMFKSLAFHGIRRLKPIAQKSMIIGLLQKE